MSINATFMGQVIFICMIVIGLLSYLLGRKKTTTPVLTGVIGSLLGFIPPVGMIFLCILVLKNDVNPISPNS